MNEQKPNSLTAQAIPLTNSNDFVVEWARRHLVEQPSEDTTEGDLTWYVGLGFLYTQYVNACHRHAKTKALYEDWLRVLSFAFPNAKQKRIRLNPVLTGVAYFEDVERKVRRFGL